MLTPPKPCDHANTKGGVPELVLQLKTAVFPLMTALAGEGLTTATGGAAELHKSFKKEKEKERSAIRKLRNYFKVYENWLKGIFMTASTKTLYRNLEHDENRGSGTSHQKKNRSQQGSTSS